MPPASRRRSPVEPPSVFSCRKRGNWDECRTRGNCDLATAHVNALEALQSGAWARAYNLGNGFSVRQVIEVATDNYRIGQRLWVLVDQPAVLVSDASSAYEELGWSPRITYLTRMIGTAWAWQQKQASPGINAERRGSASVTF
jgi:hypothetical protein